MLLILCLVVAYLVGAIPFSLIIAQRVRGIDLRLHGSGNLGATNVFRTLGPWWGALCLMLDIAKGALAVALMTLLVSSWPATEPTPLHLPPDIYRIIAGAMAALGHTFSPFVGFRGGKGVATVAGAFVVLEPFPILVCLAVFLIAFGLTRIVSVGSIAAAAVFPVATFLFEYRDTDFSKTLFFFSIVISVWMIYRHRQNILRLTEGTEKPLTDQSKSVRMRSPARKQTRRLLPRNEAGRRSAGRKGDRDVQAAILGSGSWATAFGHHLAHKWDRVILWGVEANQVNAISETGTNPHFLGDLTLPPNLHATLDLDHALRGADAVFVAVPSQAIREVCGKAVQSETLASGVPFINLSKGFELSSLKRISEVITEEIEAASSPDEHPVAVLLGPSHAEEVAREMPTAVVLAGSGSTDWAPWQIWVSGPYFRVYTNDDLVGVEVSSAFKNVIAIAVGMGDGLGLGDNTRGAIMTRGMSELARLGMALGGRQETFFGLAGIGDMITTCISRHSRNRNFGEAVALSNEDPQSLLEKASQVVEGVVMTQAGLKLGEKNNVELPITKQVHDVLFSRKPPRQAMRELMDREPRAETD